MTVALAVDPWRGRSCSASPTPRRSRIPDRVTVHAARAGIAVLAATTVRTVVQHRDDSVAGASVTAPVLAALAVGLGLWLAYRGRSPLVAVAAGLAAYLTLAAVLAART